MGNNFHRPLQTYLTARKLCKTIANVCKQHTNIFVNLIANSHPNGGSKKKFNGTKLLHKVVQVSGLKFCHSKSKGIFSASRSSLPAA